MFFTLHSANPLWIWHWSSKQMTWSLKNSVLCKYYRINIPTSSHNMKQQSQCIQSNKEHTKLKHQTRKMEEQEKEMMEEKKRDPPHLRSSNHVREDFQSPAKYGFSLEITWAHAICPFEPRMPIKAK